MTTQRNAKPAGRECPSGLTDGELLSILFQRGPYKAYALALSQRLLRHFGGIRRILNAEPAELQGVRGIGDVRMATLTAVRKALA